MSIERKVWHQTRHNLLALICLLALTTLIRLPFFFKDVINWDESTFILMGQSILDGHLPYTRLWDLKPPLAFASFALFIALFGKSLVGIRLAGTFCVGIIAFLCYFIGKSIWNQRVGLISSLFTIASISIIPGGQATMTEIVALVPTIAAFSLLTTAKEKTSWHFFWVGFLLATATLIRLNLAYVSLILGFWILGLLFYSRIPLVKICKCVFAYGLGSVIPILVTFLPYLYVNEVGEWLNSVILAPLAYASSSSSIFEDIFYPLSGMVTLLIVIIATVYAKKDWQKATISQHYTYILTLVFYFAIALSIIRGGAAYYHYLIQLMPFVGIAFAVLLESLENRTGFKKRVTATAIVILVISCYPTFFEYQTLLERLVQSQSLLYGSSYKIAAYIQQNRLKNEPIYLMKDHIVYWLIEEEPMSRCTTHPSNIGRKYLLPYCTDNIDATIESEMAYILNQKPQLIVKHPGVESYLEKEKTASELLRTTLNSDYQLAKVVNQRQIYKRKPN